MARDGADGVWVLTRELTGGSLVGPSHLEHYDPRADLLAQHTLGSDGSLSLALSPGPEPVLAGTHQGRVQLPDRQVGDGSSAGLFVAKVADDGLSVLAELALPDAPDHRVLAAAGSGDRAFVLLVLGNAAVPADPTRGVPECGAMQNMLLGFEGDALVIAQCIAAAYGDLGSLAFDGEDGVYVSAGNSLLHVEPVGQSFRYDFPEAVQSPAGAAIATDGDGVILAGGLARTLEIAGEVVGFDDAGRNLLLARFDASGTPEWARAFEVRGNAEVETLERLDDGSLLVTGTFEDALYAGGGALISAPSSHGSAVGYEHGDVFALHAEADGEPLDLVRTGEPDQDFLLAAASDGAGGAWLLVAPPPSSSTEEPAFFRVPIAGQGLPPPVGLEEEPFTRITADHAADEGFGFSIAIDGDLAVIGRALHPLYARDGGFELGHQIEHPADASADFAEELALSGGLLVVGDPAYDWDLIGRAYVYERSGDGFAPSARLQSADVKEQDQFGRAVAIIGETIFVASRKGVFVYRRDDTGAFAEQGTLPGPSGARGYTAFNAEVLATDGERLFVGMPGEDGLRPAEGAVYVYAERSDGFVLEQRLAASDPLEPEAIPAWQCTDGAVECGEYPGRGFGAGVVAADRRVIIGTDINGGGVPAVYVFERDADGAYREQTKLELPRYAGSNRETGAMPLALRGDQLAVGSPALRVRAAYGVGEVGLFALAGTAVLALGELRGIDPRSQAQLGSAVALHERALLMGAPGERGGQLWVLPLACEP